MHPDLTLNWRSAALLSADVQMLIVAAALVRVSVNKTANRCLAALLVVLSGLLTPDILGFAGFYDTFPWLSFAPFAVSLGVGPLFYLYVLGLTHGGRLRRVRWHLAPATAQFVFQAASFCLPLRLKDHWDNLSTPIVEPVVTAGVVIGLAAYGARSLRTLVRYRRVLANFSGDDERYAARWLSRCATTMLVLLTVWLAYDTYDLFVAKLTYFGGFGLRLSIAVIGCYLAIEGWRHAERRFPAIDAITATPKDGDHARDWQELAEGWAAQIRDRGWYKDPELTVASLARQLGTNSGYLSRAVNDGLGVNFSTFVARLRCEDVAATLRAGSTVDLLTLALDAGFGSKASFNRAFQATFGESPSAFRRRLVSNPE